jgi:hypothetical protein
LVFYVESLALAGGFGYAAAKLAQTNWAVLAISPMFVGAMFVYMRLIGRLAWWLAETMPADEDDSEND